MRSNFRIYRTRSECKIRLFLKKEHSTECDLLEGNSKNIIKLEAKKYEDKKEFISKCEEVMNNSSIYDRRLLK